MTTREDIPIAEIGNIRYVPDAEESAFLEEIALKNGVEEKDVIKAGVKMLLQLQEAGTATSVRVQTDDNARTKRLQIPKGLNLSEDNPFACAPKPHTILPSAEQIAKEIAEEQRN